MEECVPTQSYLCTLNRLFRSPCSTQLRWRLLPPEIIHIVFELLENDKATLRACSLAAREFSRPALSYIG